MTIILGCIIAILVSMVCLLVRGMLGPTMCDRLLATNAFGTNVVIVIVLFAFLVDDMMYIDVALVYGLINFIATIALLKYVKFRSYSGDDGEHHV